MIYEPRADELIREIHWEHEAHNEGVRRYHEAAKESSMLYTNPGQRIQAELIPLMVESIRTEFDSHWDEVTSPDTKVRANQNWVWVFGMLPPEEIAVITARVVLGMIETANERTRLSERVGEALETQLDYHQWQIASQQEAWAEGEKTSVAEKLIKKYGDQIDRKTRKRWRDTCAKFEALNWDKEDRVRIGAKLLQMMVDTCPDIFMFRRNQSSKTNKSTTLELTEAVKNDIEILHEIAANSRPFLLPTLIKPMDWHRDPESGHIKGGYWHLKQNLFSMSKHKHTAADNDATSSRFLDAVNSVQSTAWQVNPLAYEFLDGVMESLLEGESIPGFIAAPSGETLPKLSAVEWEMMTKDEQKALKQDRRRWHEEQKSVRGSYSSFLRKMDIAKRLLDKPEFFYPHFADFRGRLYPMPQELTPQSDHIGKALLQFAAARELGERGLYWLKIQVANTYGKDKELYQDRELFVALNYSKLESIAADPFSHIDELSQMDDPMLFLTSMWDLMEANASGNPERHLSRIPIAMDGVCNGMQILSLLGKDPVGAKKTNCSSDPIRYDLYNEVAAVVKQMIDADLQVSQEEVVIYWYEQMQMKGRKIVKRAVMTTPYGVTNAGISEQLINDRLCKDQGAAAYMRDHIVTAVGTVTKQAALIMQYFQSTAKVLAENGITMSWITPMGLRVTQSYWKFKRKKISTSAGDAWLRLEDADQGLDPRKCALSAAPNVVHSMDAALLQEVALRLSGFGVESVAMIHDSYGTHASEVDLLHRVIRESARDIFSGDWIRDEFHLKLLEVCPEGVELPEPPEQGTFDVEELIQALYFFS